MPLDFRHVCNAGITSVWSKELWNKLNVKIIRKENKFDLQLATLLIGDIYDNLFK